MVKPETALGYLDRCSKCGGCQAVCPLYGETGREPLVARGKLFLFKNYLEGRLELTPKFKELMSLCLLCKACSYQCPNKIPVDELVLQARCLIGREKGISFVKKNVFQYLLKNNGRLSLAAKMGYLYQKSGLRWLVHHSHILRLLGSELAQKEALLPSMAGKPFREQVPARLSCSRPRLKVAYYTGCLTNYVFPATGQAVLKVLQNQQVDIVIPEQWCCGIPALAGGDQASALELARRNVDSFNRAGVDAIVTDCASCGHMLKKYADLLETPEARSFAARVLDLSQLLDEAISFRVGPKEVPLTVTYHDPCHLRRGMGVAAAPRRLLEAIPGLKLVEMKEADRCCGAAGSFNLEYYRLSAKIGQRKVQNILQTGAEAVVTGCPSCIMQLSHNLARQQAGVKVLHLAELLSQTYTERG